MEIEKPKTQAKQIKIYLINNEEIEITGWYIRELEKENWHYYLDEDGVIYHIKKQYMMTVIEKNI